MSISVFIMVFLSFCLSIISNDVPGQAASLKMADEISQDLAFDFEIFLIPHSVQCWDVETWSNFSQIFTIDTHSLPVRLRYEVFCEC